LRPQSLAIAATFAFQVIGIDHDRTGAMAIHALDVVTKLSSRFAYEILPVTVASVIGAILVNHYRYQTPSPQ
jgi:hypothetical protein